jgi:hypothetical protein
MTLSRKAIEPSSGQRVDYDIHGIVGVRLLNATAGDIDAVTNQLGRPHGHLNRDPDIVISFKEELPTPSMKYLGLNSAGFTDDGFYVLSSSRANAKARIPFEKIGGKCEVLCESGLRSIPWLFAIINLTFLNKGYIPLHASAFVYKGVGVLVTGWTKGGKTEALLSFANHGAQYVGDEWVILSSDGEKMFGISVPICLWEWQFEHIPTLLPKIGIEKKALFTCIHFLDLVQRTFGRGRFKNRFPFTILAEALPTFRHQLNIRVSPENFFGNRLRDVATVDKLFLAMSHSESSISVEPCDPMEIAARMTNSNEYEQMPFLEYYKAFKFAFPGLENELLERIGALQHSLLCRALEGKDAYKVRHPYPVSLEALFNRMEPFCEKTPENSMQKSVDSIRA